MLSQKLKALRKQKNITLEQLANDLNKYYGLNAAKGTVSRWERGAEPTARSLYYIADYYGVAPSELLGIENIRSIDHKPSEKTFIKVLGDISCGDPMQEEEHIQGYREERKDELPKGDLFYLVTKGDSMSPTIPPNSHVLVRVQHDVEDGEIAVCLVNDESEATLKRVKKYKNYYLLMPDNPAYDPIVSNGENPVKIIGKAVRLTKDL